jgi:hypothetical protein
VVRQHQKGKSIMATASSSVKLMRPGPQPQNRIAPTASEQIKRVTNPVRDVPYYRIIERLQAADQAGTPDEYEAALDDLRVHKFKSMEALERAFRWANEMNPGGMRDRILDVLGETIQGIWRDLEMARQREAIHIAGVRELAEKVVILEDRLDRLEQQTAGVVGGKAR